MATWPVLPPSLSQPVIDCLPYGLLAASALFRDGVLIDFILDRFNVVAQRELPALASWVSGITLYQLFPLEAQHGLFDTYKLVYQSQVSSHGVYQSPSTHLWYQSVITPWEDGVIAMGRQLSASERVLVIVDNDQLAVHQLQQILIDLQVPMRVEHYNDAEQFWQGLEQKRLQPDVLLIGLQLPDPGCYPLLLAWQRRDKSLSENCPAVVWGQDATLADKKQCYQAGAVLTLNKDAYSIETLLELALGNESA